MRFAHLKTHHRFERMRLRGLSGARDEFHLAAIVQSRSVLTLSKACQRSDALRCRRRGNRQARERHVPVGMEIGRQLLLAQ